MAVQQIRRQSNKGNIMNAWQTVRQHEVASEMADRNGFYLAHGREDGVALKAKPGSEVWADDVVVTTFADFREVIVYLSGFENAKLYASIKALPKNKETS